MFFDQPQLHTPVGTAVDPSLDRLIPIAKVIDLTSMSRSTIYNCLDSKKERYFDPSFPKRIKIGKRSVRWRLSDVLIWIESKSKFCSMK